MTTILIVDDERMLVETISYNLQKEGFLVVTAHDGESALLQAKATKPQLVILDLMLPKISGWEVCRAMRQSAEHRLDAPILMLTARGEDVAPARATHESINALSCEHSLELCDAGLRRGAIGQRLGCIVRNQVNLRARQSVAVE